MLEDVPWGMVWTGSHIGAGIPSAALNTGEIDIKLMDTYFNWLDREADPKTGFWIRGAAQNKPRRKMKWAARFIFISSTLISNTPCPIPKKSSMLQLRFSIRTVCGTQTFLTASTSTAFTT